MTDLLSFGLCASAGGRRVHPGIGKGPRFLWGNTNAERNQRPRYWHLALSLGPKACAVCRKIFLQKLLPRCFKDKHFGVRTFVCGLLVVDLSNQALQLFVRDIILRQISSLIPALRVAVVLEVRVIIVIISSILDPLRVGRVCRIGTNICSILGSIVYHLEHLLTSSSGQ